MQNQRLLPRWPLCYRVKYRKGKDFLYGEGFTKDISCGGICLCSDSEFILNQHINLWIYLSLDVFVAVVGKVLWIHFEKNQIHSIGISFEDICSDRQELIMKGIYFSNQKILTKHWFNGWS